ncbi:hypothetical protein MN608_07715 [Microdochium nivale]|nr:hypothetical protein MN608_07715 [Microdochium nivale]
MYHGVPHQPMTMPMMMTGGPVMPGHPMYMQAQQQQSGMLMPMPMGPAAAPCYGSLGVAAGLGAGVGGQPFLWNNPPMVGPSIPPPPQGMASWCHPKQSPFFAGPQGSLLNPPAHVLQQQYQQQQHFYPGQPLYMPLMQPYHQHQQQQGPAVTVVYHNPPLPSW